jgi:phosphate transporter
MVQPDDIQSIPVIVYERGNAFGKKNLTIMILSLITLIMFALFQNFKSVFGDISIVSLMFVFIMFGSGMLSEVFQIFYSVNISFKLILGGL